MKYRAIYYETEFAFDVKIGAKSRY